VSEIRTELHDLMRELACPEPPTKLARELLKRLSVAVELASFGVLQGDSSRASLAVTGKRGKEG